MGFRAIVTGQRFKCSQGVRGGRVTDVAAFCDNRLGGLLRGTRRQRDGAEKERTNSVERQYFHAGLSCYHIGLSRRELTARGERLLSELSSMLIYLEPGFCTSWA